MATNRLPLSRLGTTEYELQTWTVTPEPGTKVETILTDPSYWAHCSNRFKPDHEIIVRDPERTYRMHLVVRACGANWARVVQVGLIKYETIKEEAVSIPATSDFEVKFRGAAKWSVMRKSDNAVMIEGQDKAGAARWLEEHLKNIAPAA